MPFFIGPPSTIRVYTNGWCARYSACFFLLRDAVTLINSGARESDRNIESCSVFLSFFLFFFFVFFLFCQLDTYSFSPASRLGSSSLTLFLFKVIAAPDRGEQGPGPHNRGSHRKRRRRNTRLSGELVIVAHTAHNIGRSIRTEKHLTIQRAREHQVLRSVGLSGI